MIGMTKLAAALTLGGLAWAGGKFTKVQLDARFHYDLGPAEVDVSSYPKEQQENYAIFAQTCSQCHTLARPINAPIVKREDWERYVRRMHLHSKIKAGTVVTREAAAAIVGFLAYDSKVRKVERKTDFEAKDKKLRRLFEEVKRERSRLQIEEDKRKARPAPPYTGDRPGP